MAAQKKKEARRESTIQRQEKCALHFAKNAALAVTWDRMAENNRLFYTQTSYPKLAIHYIAIDTTASNPKSCELDKIRLKMAAKTRNVRTDADKETSARNLSAVNRFNNTRMSFSGGDPSRVPICDGYRLVKQVNSVGVFPASFDTNESPREQPSELRDYRKSVHTIPIGTAVFNGNDKNGPSTIQIPPAMVPITYAPVAQPSTSSSKAAQSHGQNNSIALQSPVSSPHQRPNVFIAASNINTDIVPTTSAAALAATPSPSAVTAVASALSSQPPVFAPQLPSASIPNVGVVKVLSVNELNSRAVPSNNKENRPAQMHTSPEQPALNNASEESSYVINVTLIKRLGNEELIFMRGRQKLDYDSLSESQRAEVQHSLLVNDVWKQMLHHIMIGSPTPCTLELFRRLLPPAERQHFFRTYDASRESNKTIE